MPSAGDARSVVHQSVPAAAPHRTRRPSSRSDCGFFASCRSRHPRRVRRSWVRRRSRRCRRRSIHSTSDDDEEIAPACPFSGPRTTSTRRGRRDDKGGRLASLRAERRPVSWQRPMASGSLDWMEARGRWLGLAGVAAIVLPVAVACDAKDELRTPAPQRADGDDRERPDPPSAKSASLRTLAFAEPCDDRGCGAAPPAMLRPLCMAVDGACRWEEGPAAATYEPCDSAACSARPSASCPSGATSTGDACAKLNGASCAWVTSCTAPEIACPEANGCEGKGIPFYSVLCDGGVLTICVKVGEDACAWKHTCAAGAP